MVRIADLITSKVSSTHQDCRLILSGDTPVRNALVKMQQEGCDNIAVEVSDGQGPVVITREELLSGLLMELDRMQESVADMQDKLSEGISSQLDVVQESIKAMSQVETNKLGTAFDHMTEGLVILDADGVAERVNPSARKMLGIGASEPLAMVNDRLEEFGFTPIVQSHEEKNEGNWGEFNVKTAAGRIVKIRWTSMSDDSNDFQAGNVVTIRDVTDEIAAEKAKTEFIASISHELRTPLTSIQNAVSNLIAGVAGKMSSKGRGYLSVMKKDCHRFANMINDMVDMAKLDAGSMPVRRTVVKVPQMLADSVSSYYSQAKDKGIKLRWKQAGYISPLCIDRQLIMQVLDNLLSNAIKHTDKGGQVTLGVHQGDGDVIVTVEDTGKGVPEDLQRQIFNRFYQINRQAGAGYKGSGLGLAICDGILAVHGGSIWVESQESKGSRFSFNLPVTNASVVIQKHCDDLARKVQTKGGEMGFILGRIGIGDVSSDNVGQKVKSAIDDILLSSSKMLGQNDDIAIEIGDSEVAIVVDASKRGRIDKVQRSIQKIMCNILKSYFGQADIWPILSVVRYPNDVSEISEIEAFARTSDQKAD